MPSARQSRVRVQSEEDTEAHSVLAGAGLHETQRLSLPPWEV